MGNQRKTVISKKPVRPQDGRGRPRRAKPIPFQEVRLLGARVEELRKDRGWTQADLCGSTGLSGPVIGGVERNTKPVLFPTAVRIADALQCSLDYLAGRSNNPKVSP